VAHGGDLPRSPDAAEETYRAWARRFARFIAPRTPDAAGAEEVGAFLSDLAVRQRVAPSTQKQAA
jgi:hypothetical protein